MIQVANQDVISQMGWKGCAFLVASAGAIGGLINAYFTDHGIRRPSISNGVWCPGAIGNVVVGAISAFVSWALYGSGAVIDVANPTGRELVGLRLAALAGALLVGVAGARWLSSEVNKALLDKSVECIAQKPLSPDQMDELRRCDTARKVLQTVGAAS